MKRILKRLVVLLIVAAAAWWLWSNRDSIAVLSNNNVRIQGDWHPVEMEFNEPDTYTFTEHIISKASWSPASAGGDKSLSEYRARRPYN